jgi:hypothetical protein
MHMVWGNRQFGLSSASEQGEEDPLVINSEADMGYECPMANDRQIFPISN